MWDDQFEMRGPNGHCQWHQTAQPRRSTMFPSIYLWTTLLAEPWHEWPERKKPWESWEMKWGLKCHLSFFVVSRPFLPRPEKPMWCRARWQWMQCTWWLPQWQRIPPLRSSCQRPSCAWAESKPFFADAVMISMSACKKNMLFSCWDDPNSVPFSNLWDGWLNKRPDGFWAKMCAHVICSQPTVEFEPWIVKSLRAVKCVMFHPFYPLHVIELSGCT